MGSMVTSGSTQKAPPRFILVADAISNSEF